MLGSAPRRIILQIVETETPSERPASVTPTSGSCEDWLMAKLYQQCVTLSRSVRDGAQMWNLLVGMPETGGTYAGPVEMGSERELAALSAPSRSRQVPMPPVCDTSFS